AESSEKISFNMIHESCGSRVQQQLFCPTDERNVERSEIVKGYEFSKGQYVLFNPEELKALEATPTEAIEISEFLPSSEIDPIYFAKSFYLAPDKGASRAYTLLAKAMQETGRWALATYSARGKQYLTVIRPLDNGLVMQQLFYANEIRSFAELDISDAVVNEKELKMAVQLAEMGAAEEFHPENYHDEVQQRVRDLINEKVESGREITASATAQPKQAQVINLMEALRASLSGSNPKAAKSSRQQASSSRSAPSAPVNIESKRKSAKQAPSKATVAAPAAKKSKAR
ncbi:MAG: Ku protein, partial [Acidobacteria bacterium]|nr:Ku protein [Acidobacteriota bacterium]